ncbi:MAG: DUF1223 domain-containing protein [Pseudomonadota bacterium]
MELFTSQGCSSCPPADAALGELAKRADVVALSLHVDYWDYLGWRDTFASRANTKRQYAYRESFGARVVYTPQMVIQGVGDAVGSRGAHVADLISMAKEKAVYATLDLATAGEGLVARLLPIEGASVAGVIWVARYVRSRSVDIGRGENRGRQITYHNVVESLENEGSWEGRAPWELALDPPGQGEGVAVWLQEGRTGPIFAAAKFER